nr:hypothetical protein [Tanacetum cinerariifolium]
MSRMEDDLFTYEVEIAEVTNIPCELKKEDDSERQMPPEFDNDMEYDPSNAEFTEWLALKKINYKTMDHYTMKSLWSNWSRGDNEVEGYVITQSHKRRVWRIKPENPRE